MALRITNDIRKNKAELVACIAEDMELAPGRTNLFRLCHSYICPKASTEMMMQELLLKTPRGSATEITVSEEPPFEGLPPQVRNSRLSIRVSSGGHDLPSGRGEPLSVRKDTAPRDFFVCTALCVAPFRRGGAGEGGYCLTIGSILEMRKLMSNSGSMSVPCKTRSKPQSVHTGRFLKRLAEFQGSQSSKLPDDST